MSLVVDEDTVVPLRRSRRTGQPVLRSAPRTHQPDRSGPYLPSPPDDEERDLYLESQSRWVSLVSMVGYLLIVVSTCFFVSLHHWALPLVIPLGFSLAATLLAFVTNVRKRRITLPQHRATVASWAPDRYPSVDVYLPSAGESLVVIENTFRYVSELVWPGEMTVYALDDSNRASMRDLAAKYGFEYLARPEPRILKKAGNLRYGFEHSSGEFSAILDADFVPRPDFLLELMPYFDDPACGIVQSPQYYDSEPWMGWLQRASGSTQVLFYRYVQVGRDRSDGSVCVGTCALYRRTALDAIGGFAAIGHSEDIHTGVKMIGKGFYTRYVATVLTKGVTPINFAQFCTQQYRWCQGSMSLLFDRTFHRLTMNRWQRACFWAGFLFYVSTAIDILCNALPGILLAIFDPQQVRFQNYIFIVAALMVRQAIIPTITNGLGKDGRVGDSLINLVRIQTTYSLCHVVQLWDMARDREQGWIATGTIGSSTKIATRVLRIAQGLLIAFQVMLWGAVAWRLPEYGIAKFWPMVAFGLLDLYIILPIITGRADLPKPLAVIRHLMETGHMPQARVNVEAEDGIAA